MEILFAIIIVILTLTAFLAFEEGEGIIAVLAFFVCIALATWIFIAAQGLSPPTKVENMQMITIDGVQFAYTDPENMINCNSYFGKVIAEDEIVVKYQPDTYARGMWFATQKHVVYEIEKK